MLAEGLVAAGFWAVPKLLGTDGGEDEVLAGALPDIGQSDSAFVVSVNYSTTDPTNQDVQVVVEAENEIQLSDGWAREDDNAANKMTKTFSENTVESVRVLDFNDEAVNIEVIIANIDKTPPAIRNLWYSTREPTSGYVTVSFEASEEVMVPDGWEYRNNAQRYVRTFWANWSGTIVVKDLAGNTARASVVVSNIDKTLGEEAAPTETEPDTTTEE